MEERVEIAKEFLIGLLERMEITPLIKGDLKEGNICFEIKADKEGVLIGKHGRTLEALQFILNRMVNKRLKEPLKVILDINGYLKRREERLTQMAIRIGEKAKAKSRSLTIGPFNSHDRRIIHMALKSDPFIQTESFGEGEMKRIKILPKKKEGRQIESFE